ncbi:acyltransferase [Mesobaculum littorinae]|uniref:Acyltransferase n=1 Tax=Mesobaculum littorinae TaxID=2486419 RepID=A0A438AKR3_9RHOB|nr:lysophospholipid acyltransferase family protein [Mesobaculum littorinae]RVV99259.1 acyltransferase [Mesobaculum littorinae]
MSETIGAECPPPDKARPREARQIARQISYAASARTRAGRAVIRTIENACGRPGLIRRARGYQDDIAGGADFWQVMLARYGVSVDIVSGTLAPIPRQGPLVVVANHPFGILDGLVMGALLGRLRGDFRILAHRVFAQAGDLDRVILPVDFDETMAAQETNIATRRAALQFLGDGGAIGVFPGGTVSTAARPFSRPLDPVWRGFTARMIARSDATVVPVYFDGANSRLFQLASHAHYTLRMGLLMSEFRARTDRPVQIAVGAPLGPATLAPYRRDPRGMMDFLRERTYALSPTPPPAASYGFEFEARYKD